MYILPHLFLGDLSPKLLMSHLVKGYWMLNGKLTEHDRAIAK